MQKETFHLLIDIEQNGKGRDQSESKRESHESQRQRVHPNVTAKKIEFALSRRCEKFKVTKMEENRWRTV